MRPVCRLLRRGFSMVELLVVIAVVGLLIALLVPAVQRVRAAAANAECSNNLKQIGLGLQNYHDTYGYYPRYTTDYWPTFPDPPYGWPYSWMYYILPSVGQEALYNQGSFTQTNLIAFWSDERWQVAAANWQKTCTTIVPNFLCPAEPRSYVGGIFNPDGPPGVDETDTFCAMTSYLGVLGREWAGYPDDGTGIFGREVGVKSAQITDGLSNTVMVGERPPSRDNSVGWWVAYYTNSSLFAIGNLRPYEQGKDEQGKSRPCPDRSYFSPGNLIDDCHADHFWSFHAGGGNWLLCDGSVRCLAYSAEK
jgi:prepilin-type N-terminal cleavage/methylation domain-containing protein/prepilin-type processing-associated H-X9-DG protein